MPIKKTLQNSDNTGRRALLATLWKTLLVTGRARQHAARSIDILKTDLLPDQDKMLLEKKHSILSDYISSETNIPYELILINTYGGRYVQQSHC